MIPLCIAVTIVLTTIAQLLLRWQARTLVVPTGWADTPSFILACSFNPWLWLVFGCAVVSMLSWSVVLTRLPLNVAYPFSGLVFCAILLAGWLVLGERPSITTVIGTLVIAAGVAIVGFGKA